MRLVCARFQVALVMCLFVVLACATSAGAFSVSSVTATPQDPAGGPLPASGRLAAGAHPDFAIRIDFNESSDPSDSVKDLAVHLAPGIVAYVNHVPECSQANFAVDNHTTAANCPGSAVGTVVTGLTSDNPLVNVALDPPLGEDPKVTGTIYRIEPPAGSPAAFGIDIAPPIGDRIKLISPISVDPHDLGLTASLSGLPNSATLPGFGAVGLHTNYIVQTLRGYVGGKSFFTNPTSCIPAAATVSAGSYSGASGSASGSFTPVDCAGVPFSTTLGITVDPPISDFTSTVSTNVKPGEADIPRANSHVKSTTVTLPQSLLLNPALAARLDACTDAQFALTDTSVEAKCPASSGVGDINFVSPILGAFPGKAYFGTSAPGDRLRLFLDVPLFGAHIKVSAHVRPDRTTGQITTIFDLLPQIAFTDFTLTFKGGPRSALVTPTVCGNHTATAITSPWSSPATPSTSTGGFSVSFDGKGAACQRLFTPSFETAVSDSRGGASPTFTLVANRPDRHVPIGRMTYQLPAGLVGNISLSGLTQCELNDAAAAKCPAASRLGPVTAVVGSGTEPPSLPGNVYLTKPKAKGDPAGLSVAVPAQLGPVDAGIVIVGVRLQLRPDGGLLATSDPIPALQEGIPLAIRKLTITIDRKGFMRNPSSCGTKTSNGHFDDIGGGTADASTTLNIAACDRLRFKPRIKAVLGAKGKNRARAHPPFVTTITAGAGDAAIGRAYVRLPAALATGLDAINAACAQTDFDAGRCSDKARVANARAVSPLFSQPVTGPVYLVKRTPGLLPKLVVQLRDPIAIQFEGTITVGKRGRIATTFAAVPDLPITSFRLSFHSGRYGALSATTNLCKKRGLRLPTKFTGQNGATVKQRAKIAIKGCAKKKLHRNKGRAQKGK